jgi:hypothetical protein
MARIISQEVQSELRRLHKIEEGLAKKLAEDLFLPSSAVIVSVHPIPKVELKVPASPAQLLEVHRFLDRIGGTPSINGRSSSGLN